MKKKRSLAILSAVVLTMALLAGCGGAKEQTQTGDQTPANQNENSADELDPLSMFPKLELPYEANADETIVEYEGGKLSAGEFETFLRVINFINPQQGSMISMADQEMIKVFAREYTATKILASRADEAVHAESVTQAEQTFEQIKGQYMSFFGEDAESKFAGFVEGHGVTKETIVEQMAIINDSITVLRNDLKDEDLKQIYDKMDVADRTLASVRHILISSETRTPEEALKIAQDVEGRLKNGEDFAQLAQEFSEDPGSKDNGGLYENAVVAQWVPEFKEAALTQPVGEVGPPVKTDYGYHIVKVESRQERTFDEMKDQLSGQALEAAYDSFSTDELDKLIVTYNIPEIKNAQAE
ncbi:peptidylprolyl isomerase [Brevibacillus sp. TJ4]|uniref:peptidylprolyl isomerase n=1 Tax=Brevibacillus sp. TJ4 TaxID=3234853 RepID=UPI003B9E5943